MFDGKNGRETIDRLERVMEVLCAEFTGISDTIETLFMMDGDKEKLRLRKPRKRRKRTKTATDGGYMSHGVFEPYMKMEVLETPRTDTNYSLRNVLKRKRFADEVSINDAVSDSEKEDISDDEESDGFDPEMLEVDEYDEEYDEGDDDGDEEPTDSSDEDDELMLMEEDNYDLEEDLFQDDYKDDIKPRFGGNMRRRRGDRMMDPSLDPEAEESGAITVYNVKIAETGEIEVLEPDDQQLQENGEEEEGEGEGGVKVKVDLSSKGEIGRVVAVMDDIEEMPFRGQKLLMSVSEKSHPRSLLKPPGARAASLLFCSVCENAFATLKELKHHVAKEHPGSRFFALPKNNPHRNCAPCNQLMQSYESLIRMDPDVLISDVCFPCPHCRRRYIGHLGGLANHLNNDHRHAIDAQMLTDPQYFDVFLQHDPKVAICEFCSQDCGHVDSLNKHLVTCPDNTSGHSAGLFCSICGKMFAQTKNLKGHLMRHGRDKLGRPRDKYCAYCPVACTSESALQKHMDKEHSSQNPDEGFVLHESKFLPSTSRTFDTNLKHVMANLREWLFYSRTGVGVLVRNSSGVGSGMGARHISGMDLGMDFLLAVFCIILKYKHIGHPH
jgi:hypothetical protein